MKSDVPLHPSLHSIEPQISTRMREDLDHLATMYNQSQWLSENKHEPHIGDPDAPALADEYGARGRSCYAVFVSMSRDGTYGCFHDSCFLPVDRGGYSARSLDQAIRHQRYHHFYHQPFECVPVDGTHW